MILRHDKRSAIIKKAWWISCLFDKTALFCLNQPNMGKFDYCRTKWKISIKLKTKKFEHRSRIIHFVLNAICKNNYTGKEIKYTISLWSVVQQLCNQELVESRLPYERCIITGVFFLCDKHHFWYKTLKCATKYAGILVNISIQCASAILGQS